MALVVSCLTAALAQDKHFEASGAPTAQGWAENTRWYYLKPSNTDSYHPASWLSAGEGYVDSEGRMTLRNALMPADDFGLWCFVGNDTDGYTIYNKGAGVDKVFGLTGSEADAYCKMYDAANPGDGVTVLFDYANSEKNFESAGCFKLHGSTNDWLNNRDQGVTGGAHLALWSADGSGPKDNGSALTFVDASTELYNGKYFKIKNCGRKAGEADAYLSVKADGGKTTGGMLHWEADPGDKAVWTARKLHSGLYNLYNPYSRQYIAAIPSAIYQHTLVNPTTPGTYDIQTLSADGNVAFRGGNNTATLTDQQYLHADANTGHPIVKWDASGATGASRWIIEFVPDADLAAYQAACASDEALAFQKSIPLARLNTIKKTKYAWEEDATKIGYSYSTPEATRAYKTAHEVADNAGATTDEMYQAITGLDSYLDDNVSANDVSSRYYRIETFNRNAGRWVYADPREDATAEADMGNRGVFFKLQENLPNKAMCLWQLEVVDGVRYYVKHVNSGKCFGQISSSQQVMLPVDRQYAGKFLFDRYQNTAAADNVWTMAADVNNGQYVSSQNASEGNVTSWGDKNDPGAGWKFVEVSSVPVAVSAAGYATLQLPMAVELPAGLTAYTATVDADDASRLLLHELGNVVPANTPVILSGDAATYELTFSDSDAEAPAQDLRGTNIGNNNMEADTYYGLANKNGQPGLYLSGLTTITANKAYLPKPVGTAAPAFHFGNVSTGMEGVTAEPSGREEYYDLNGRRVLYPAKGIYVTAKGKKVFVK